MPRPQKYTDADIADAIESLVADGEEVNPSRVRLRLGGGNAARIRTVIEHHAGQLAQSRTSADDLPESVRMELQRAESQILKHTRLLANKCWKTALEGANASLGEKYVSQQKRIEALEADLAISAAAAAKFEAERDESLRQRDIAREEKIKLAQQCDQLTAALRNAESDLRATEKTISVLERTQREDRDEIRRLQKRIEGLVEDLAVLNVGPKRKRPQRHRD